MAIAEEMGVALQATATSVNIKERLDFSCALFDADGALIANAPHIPVHLGSMGESIRTIIDARGDGARRARHPARRRLCAQRSLSRRHAPARHHRDRAGVPATRTTRRPPSSPRAATTPTSAGSRPDRCRPTAARSTEEGVLIDNVLLVDEGRFREAEMRALLGGGEWPARSPDRNIADLKAQLAACSRGADMLAAIAARLRRGGRRRLHGPRPRQCRGIGAPAARPPRGRRVRLRDGQWRAWSTVAIRVDRAARSAVFDFTGTSAQLAGQFQRAALDRPRRLALCRAHADRRRHPDERRLPAPDRR